jgi:hypothetical protein
LKCEEGGSAGAEQFHCGLHGDFFRNTAERLQGSAAFLQYLECERATRAARLLREPLLQV